MMTCESHRDPLFGPRRARRGWRSAAFWFVAGLSGLAPLLLVVFARGDDVLEARRKQVESMTAVEKEELLRKKEEFEQLPPAEQDRLRRFHQELSQDPDSQRLRRIMIRYDQWLAGLPASQRAEILSLDAPARIAEIKKVLAEQEKEWFRRLVDKPLPVEDRKAILEWLGSYMDRHESEIVAGLPEDFRRRLQEVHDPRRRHGMLMFGLLAGRHWSGAESPGREIPAPDESDVAELIGKLSPQTQEILRSLDSPESLRQLLRWAGAAMYAERRRLPPVTDEELRRFIAQLPAEKRAYLETLPRERLRREALLLYHRSRRDGEGLLGGRFFGRSPGSRGRSGGGSHRGPSWPRDERGWPPRPGPPGARGPNPPPPPEPSPPPEPPDQGARKTPSKPAGPAAR